MTREEFFDKLRKAVPGIWNRPSAIKEGNELFDAMRVPDAPSEPERPLTPHKIGPEGTALIKRYEGLHKLLPNGMIQAYPDPGSGNLPITIGYGSTLGLDGKPIPKGTQMTREQVDALFARDMESYAKEVEKALGSSLARTSQKQFDAMVSFHYNTGAIGRATLTAKHKAGDYKGAAREFDRWTKAGGRVLNGLVKRRASERELYERGS